MSSKRLLRLIGSIDDEFILNAAEYHPTKARKLHTPLVISIVVSVACIAILISGVIKYTDYAREHQPSMLATHGIKSTDIVYIDNISEGNISGINVKLQIIRISDSFIDVGYVIDDENYTGNNLYTFDTSFRLQNEDHEDLIETAPPLDEDRITLEPSGNQITVKLPDTCCPLKPGKYTLYGYVFSENGDYGYIAVEFMVP